MKVKNDRIPTTTNPRKIPTSINNDRTDPPTTKISSLISSVITQLIFPTNLTMLNHAIISMTFDLRNTNSAKTPPLKNAINQQKKVTIINKLKRLRTTTATKQTTNMPNHTKIINTKVNSSRSL